MGFEQNKPRSFLHRWANQLMMGTMVLLLAVFLVVVHNSDLDNISFVADETLSFMRSVCQRYDGYATGHRISALKDIYDKANGLASLAPTEDLQSTTYLERFIDTQSLTGVLVTDGSLSPVGQTDSNGEDAGALWAEFLQAEDKRNIVKYKKKSYSGTAVIGGREYEVAVVSRRDAKGLVLCYKICDTVSTDVYETSLEKTLDNNTFHKNPCIVVTDGTTVLASNIPDIASGSLVSDCVIQETSEFLWSENALVRLNWQGAQWFGKRMAYEQYYIYVFYPSAEVFDNMLPIVSISVAIYALLCTILLLMRYASARRYRLREQRQLNTIRAISTLFVTTSILHLDKDEVEGIISTPRAQAVLDESTKIENVAANLAEQIIAPAYRQQYVDFLDAETIDERMRGKNSISSVCQDVNGVWFAVYLIPMEHTKDGRLKDVLFASRDINSYMRSEKEYQEKLRATARDAALANAAKSSFLRRMSHDLRTPINGIRGMAAMAEQSLQTPDKARNYIEKIIASSDYLQSILEDILRMSKLESGRLEMEDRTFSLDKVVADTRDFIAARADESNVHFTMKIEELHHPQVFGSPLHLRQVMQNILSNAVKFTPAGGSIHAVCREISCTDDVMRFEFVCTDTGIGMSEEFQKHLFEPFAQENDSARSVLMGTGLGLPIAKEILDRMDGTISVQSRQGEGSIFTVKLPLKIDTAANLPQPEHDQQTLDGVRILVVEDNDINMEVARYMLESRGAQVTEARNGREALDVFSTAAPGSLDVILMDIMMPEMDGLEATRRIRAMPRADAQTIPIFAMTANAFVDDINMSRAAGMNEHLAKPLNMDEVTAAICRYCR